MNGTLVLIRGLPGSGKTTFARLLTDWEVAADDFFTDDQGVYKYDPSRLSEAHRSCLTQTEVWIRQGIEVIAVHNTFAENRYMDPYAKLAKEHEYQLTIVKMERQFTSIHNVPEYSMRKMHNRWEECIL